MLTAPFPWFGGKRRLAPTILERLGAVEVYAEPFAGSLACLLRSEPHAREVVCDTDGGVVNFWRALRSDPEAVAYHADWPTFHDDLTARHRWLVRWVVEHGERLREDPDYYDAKAAGWWVWGISIWIGGGWCQPNYRNQAAPDRIPKFVPSVPKGDGQIPKVMANGTPGGVSIHRSIPHDDGKRPRVNDDFGGRGVSVQRTALPCGDGQMPECRDDYRGGSGVAQQRAMLPHRDGARPAIPGGGHVTGAGVAQQRGAMPVTPDRRPYIEPTQGGRGVSAQNGQLPGSCDGSRLLPWLSALAARLQRVIVLNRDWRSAVTPSVLAQTPTGPKPPVGILLDPPYLTAERSSEVYGSDMDGTSSDVAADAWAWAQEHGDRYRIAYCCHEGDVEVPDGWDVVTETFAGIRDAKRRDRRDMVVFSPACVGAPQGRLW